MLNKLFTQISTAYNLESASPNETIANINIEEELAEGMITLIATAHKLGVSSDELYKFTIDKINKDTKSEEYSKEETVVNTKKKPEGFHLAVASIILKLFN